MMQMTLRQLMRYDELHDEIEAKENLNMAEVLMFPVVAPNVRQQARQAWSKRARVAVPTANRIKKADIRNFLSGLS